MSVAAEGVTHLPAWLQERLDSCPATGDGVHQWEFSTARHLLAHFDEPMVCKILFAAAQNCGRPLRKLEREIAVQVKAAMERRWQPRNPSAFHPIGAPAQSASNQEASLPPASNWPEPDEPKIRQIVGNDLSLVDLWERSPIRFNDEDSHAEEIIDILFPGDPLLCVGRSSYSFATRRRETWRGTLHRLPLIVPNPMCEVIGYTAEGRLSEHAKEQTARRVYLVVEFDFSEFGRDGKTLSRWASLVREWRAQDTTVADACAALHLHLAELLPLVCVPHSGGKSLHGWYYALDHSARELRRFMEYAAALGADRATWNRSQFVRIPDGRRDDGRRQTAFYLDPAKAVQIL